MKRALIAAAALLISSSLTFAQTGGVRGKVQDDKGQPLEGTVVTMEFDGGMTLKFETKANKKGEFMQIGLRPGNWKFSYAKEGYQPFSSPMRISLGDATVLPDVKLNRGKAGAAPGAPGADDLQKTFGEAVGKLQANDFDGAITAFDAIIAKNPTLPEAYYNKGFAQYQKKDYAASETTLKKALELKADYGDARVLLSNVYTAQGNKEKALEVMTSGGSSDPRQLFNLGVALLNSGKTDEATAAFLKAEAGDPTNAEVQFYLGTAALNSGKTDECVTRLEKYLSMSPKNEQNKATATGLIAALKPKK